MKNEIIINSWNKINTSDTAHRRILGNIINNVHTGKKKKSYWKIIMPVAACMAVVLVSILTIPGPGEPGEPIVVGVGESLQHPWDFAMQGNAPSGSDAREQALEASPPLQPMYALTLNELYPPVEPRMFIPGHFSHDVTPRQLQAILPDLGFPITGTVSYYRSDYRDDALFDIIIYETQGGYIARFNEVFIRTTIRIAPRPIFTCAIIEYESEISYVSGIPVTAGVFDRMSDWAGDTALYIAYFEMDSVFYRIQLYDYTQGDSGLNRLTEIVNTIILNGAAYLTVLDNPVIPELRDDRMTIEEARLDPDFGAYLPTYVPEGFSPDEARRTIDQHFNGIFAHWHMMGEMNSISWNVSLAEAHDLANVVSINEPQKFDLSLYSVPLADTVPDEYMQFVTNPVFLAEELTFEAVQSRNLYGRGSSRLNFGVLFGDIAINISVMDVSPEQVWDMILSIKR